MKNTKQKPHLAKSVIIWSIVILLILGYVAMTIFSSPKAVASVSNIDLPESTQTKIAWPSYGQAAVGASGFGVAATNGEQVAHPIASIAKVILAISVLDKYPLAAGQTGPTITMTQADIDFYHSNLAQNGSLVPVNVGEQLTEYQMLQGLLIASGDNIADTLAIWTFGSVDNYLAYANKMVTDMGLNKTHIADSSGLSPQTVSSAHDLVLLGEKSLGYVAIADIVNQQKVTLPVAGTLSNYDTLLGQNGVIGIKTGNTDEAGGCFLFAVKNDADVNGPTVIGAILGAKNLATVLYDSRTFIQANVANFKTVSVLHSGQVIGTYSTPWGQKIDAVVAKDLTMFMTSGGKVTTNVSLKDLDESTKKGAEVGVFAANTSSNSETIPVILNSDLTAPTFWWKLAHPFK